MASVQAPSLPDRRNVVDKSSLANHRSVRAVEAVWTAQLRFDSSTIDANVDYLFECQKDLEGSEAKVDLDTSALAIRGVHVNGLAIPFRDLRGSDECEGYSVLKPETAPFGRQLSIPLGRNMSAGDTFAVSIEYSTTDESSALQWLDASQTNGKTQPFVFTQCQAIHARTLLPCPDTPAHKLTFRAFVAAPAPITVLMSALGNGGSSLDGESGLSAAREAVASLQSRASTLAGSGADREEEPAATGSSSSSGGAGGDALHGFSFEEDHAVHSFHQPRPVPTYLIALAAGALEHRAITDSVGVWAEPGVVDAAKKEFDAAPHFLSEAEALLGPYVWGRYDVLVMPPSFPYGGMENPCLTFATPTLLAGDGSLADVVAHEIIHSWSGNGFTCCAWEDFWLNEGFTMMGQRKVVAAVREKHTHKDSIIKGDAFFAFDSFDGAGKLAEELETLASRGHSKYTKLVPDMSGVDPDESFSVVPYEKGYHFLCFFQEKLGGKARFEPWLKSFTLDHMGKSISRFDFQKHITDYFAEPANDGGETVDMDSIVDWDAWYYTEGNPPEPVSHDGSVRTACEKLAWDYITNPSAVKEGLLASWANDAHLLIAFAKHLAESAKQLASMEPPQRISADVLAKIDRESGLSTTGNCELRMAWTTVAMLSGLPGAIEQARDFLVSFGRMKYARPLLALLAGNADGGREVAVQVVKEHGDWYHPICGSKLQIDLRRLLQAPATSPSDAKEIGTVSQPAGAADSPVAAATDGKTEAGPDQQQPAKVAETEETEDSSGPVGDGPLASGGASKQQEEDDDDGLDDILNEMEVDEVIRAAQNGDPVPATGGAASSAGAVEAAAPPASSTGYAGVEAKSDEEAGADGKDAKAAEPSGTSALPTSLEPKAYEYGDDDYDGNDMEDTDDDSEEESEEEEESESEEEEESEEEDDEDEGVGNGENEALLAMARQQAEREKAERAAAGQDEEEDDDGEENSGAAGDTAEGAGVGGRGDSLVLPPASGGASRWAPQDLNRVLQLQPQGGGPARRARFGDLPAHLQDQVAKQIGIKPLSQGSQALETIQEAPAKRSRTAGQKQSSKMITGAMSGGSSSPKRAGGPVLIGYSSNFSSKLTIQTLSKEEKQTDLPAAVKEMESMGQAVVDAKAEEAGEGAGAAVGTLSRWVSPSAWLQAAGSMPLVRKDWQPAVSKAIATTGAVVVVSAGVLSAIAVVDLARGKSPLESVRQNSWRFLFKPALAMLSGKSSSGEDGDPFVDDPFGSSAASGAAPLSRGPSSGAGSGGQ